VQVPWETTGMYDGGQLGETERRGAYDAALMASGEDMVTLGSSLDGA
jgi:hypothetical protein